MKNAYDEQAFVVLSPFMPRKILQQKQISGKADQRSCIHKIIAAEYDRGIERLKRTTELVCGAVAGTVEITNCGPCGRDMHTLTKQERLLGGA